MGGLTAGEVLLVHGGASGIGTTAIQVAKALGATVVVTARGAVKRAICERLDADKVIDYEQEDFVAKVREFTDGRGVDVILDVRGGDYLARNLDSLARRGRLLIVGVQGGREGVLPIGVLLQKAAVVTAASLRHRPLEEKAAVVAGVRRDIWPLVERGAVAPVIDSVYRIEDADAAHQRMSSGEHAGKMLLVQDELPAGR
jgi:NADPH:quinone reductase-like Zn-dependent oxidoreductase